MNEEEYLLTLIQEECAEISQRASKALRFGMEEIQDGQDLNNARRIILELMDLEAVCDLLREENPIFDYGDDANDFVDKKKEKVLKWMEYSRQQGRLS